MTLSRCVGELAIAHHPRLSTLGQAIASPLAPGLSELIPTNIRLLNQPKSPLETFLFSVQWTREALRSFQFPIVLWVTQRIAAELAKQAPDFWSWRGGVFEFFQPTDAPSPSQNIIIPTIPAPSEDENFANIAELQRQSLNLATELNYTWLMAHSNYDLAQLYRAKENPTLAKQHYEIAHQLFTKLGAKKDVEKIEKEWRDFEF